MFVCQEEINRTTSGPLALHDVKRSRHIRRNHGRPVTSLCSAAVCRPVCTVKASLKPIYPNPNLHQVSFVDNRDNLAAQQIRPRSPFHPARNKTSSGRTIT